MELRFKDYYRKISTIKIGEKVVIEGNTFILADNGYLINIENGVSKKVSIDDTIRISKSLPRINIRDITIGEFFLNQKGELYICTCEYEDGEFFCPIDNTWFNMEDLIARTDSDEVYWIPNSAIEIVIKGYRK